MRCEHEHEDGAYVLGALSPAERGAYERHLATCSFCREAVADMARMPDLLSRMDASEFAQLFEPGLAADDPDANRRRPYPGAPVRRIPANTDARSMHGNRRKTLGVRVVSAAAGAMLVAIIGLGVLAWTRDTATPGTQPAGPAVAMVPVSGAPPVTANIRLASAAGGTRVKLVCRFSATADRPYTFRLLAFGPDDDLEQLGSWEAAPGATFAMEGVTHFARGSLARLELVQSDGKALLAYDAS